MTDKPSMKMRGRDLQVGVFHTCKSKAESEEWIKRFNDPHVTTAFMVGWNSAMHVFRNVEVPK